MEEDLKALVYQVECLKYELDFLEQSSSRKFWPSFRRHCRQFRSTILRVLSRPGSDTHARFPLENWAGVPFAPLSAQSFGAPRIFIDATITSHTTTRTGIQRVVIELSKSLYKTGLGLPVFLFRGALYSAVDFKDGLKQIRPQDGDCLLLLDASWLLIDEFTPVLWELLSTGVRIIPCFHDLIPFEYPGLCRFDTVASFKKWFDGIIPFASEMLCVSQNTAVSLERYLERSGLAWNQHLPIHSFLPGTNTTCSGKISECMSSAQASYKSPFFLTVGTIEPRKGHMIALSAFERLWDRGVDVNYVIVGRYGWNMRFFEAWLHSHRFYGTRLFWVDDASDADLDAAYRHAKGLILPSIAEGFGLPIAESRKYQLPVILSDIPVFREVGGEQARYFEVGDIEKLAEIIADLLEHGQKCEAQSTRQWTWQDSAYSIIALLGLGAPP